MKKPSSEPQAPAASRIIAAEALGGVSAVGIGALGREGPRERRLTTRDLANETARAAYELGRRRGYEHGVRAGREQGYAEGSQALDAFQSGKAAEVAGRMTQLAEQFGREMAALEAQAASDLVSLAIDIARQVLRRELAHDAAALLPAAREALRMLGEGASQLEVLMHPDDAALVAPRLEQVQSGRCSVHADAQLPRGGCRVMADTGIADAGFESRWQAVMAELGRDEEPLP